MSIPADQVSAKMKVEQIRQMGLDLKREGCIALFKSSCLNGDGVNADRYRAELHSILDNQLDCLSQQMMLFSQLSK